MKVTTRAAVLADAEQQAAAYRRSQTFGLLLIALLILVAILVRADMRTLFPPGWWRF